MLRLIFTLFMVLSAVACSSSSPALDAAVVAPTLATVTAERTDLMFRYESKDGPGSATTIAEIPEAARRAVQVVDLSLTPEARGAGRYVQLFDLRAPGADGQFKGRLVERAALEAALAEAQAVVPQALVTMYSASWCGVCNKARAFMTKEGIAFVEKDIEKDRGAADELRAKAKRAGVDSSGVPVFDVAGQILPGFDPGRLTAALKPAP